MKIESGRGNVASNISVTSPQNRASANTQTTAGSDKVQISAFSSSLQKAEARIADTPIVDKGRVEEIRQAITEGRFKVDPSRIADGLIDSVRQMLVNQAP